MKQKVLLCGSEVTKDKELLKILKKIAKVLLLRDYSQIKMIILKQNIDLVVIELTKDWEDELSIVRLLKTNLPQILIIIVNGGGDRDIVLMSFRSGVNDFFKKPYKPGLLAERMEALLKANSSPKTLDH